jgi:hypothetical protein
LRSPSLKIFTASEKDDSDLGTIAALQHMAALHSRRGEHERALELAKRALPMAKARIDSGDEMPEQALILHNMACEYVLASERASERSSVRAKRVQGRRSGSGAPTASLLLCERKKELAAACAPTASLIL